MKSSYTLFRPFEAVYISPLSRYIIVLLVFIFIFSIAKAGNQQVPGLQRQPVMISEILVTTSGQNLLLSWQVDKADCKYYEVERSQDAKNFSTIGLVMDVMDNSTTCQFKEKKSRLISGTAVWFRIKGILADGTVIYSSVRKYQETNPVNLVVNAVYSPNPFTNTVEIHYISKEKGLGAIELLSLAGIPVLSKQTIINKGSNTIRLNGLDNINAGIYMAKLSFNGCIIAKEQLVKN